MKLPQFKMLSQLTKRSSAGFLKRHNTLQIATVRYQSNKTASSDEKTKAEVAAKVAKQKQLDKYNALSNQNLMKQQKQSSSQNSTPKKLKKVKKDYSAIPKVPSTKYFTYHEIAYDKLMNGHRPLLLFHRHTDELSALDNFFKPQHFWNTTAVGSDKLSEWNNVPYDSAYKLKPFTPPSSPQDKIKQTEEELTGFIDNMENSTPSKKSNASRSLKKGKASRRVKNRKTRGRIRPSYDFDYNNNPDDY
ncbi:hypothetical protein BN7_34 [Wickerhamomyces ciferrii]|uniref:Uncharacterized protein n=1 Tax=Wickerhamomyces ciferrii (strain ATCC 14091 / BCRC 22168 / CBS 111 / JCM 3599 / NBRC 0793 / NRRL Y-1031 F-60-10) TaxID=1206466 RepID=K0KC77_WICCF|nr:uncharacterized protein BN7_34 [Wickerhamomyces ciferrii]CCH40501.1 hypothetical protein BN7_34 [Wickerhamomyces ciferrii]